MPPSTRCVEQSDCNNGTDEAPRPSNEVNRDVKGNLIDGDNAHRVAASSSLSADRIERCASISTFNVAIRRTALSRECTSAVRLPYNSGASPAPQASDATPRPAS